MVESSSKKAKVEKEELKDSDYNNFRLMRAIKENHGLSINQIIMGFNSKQLNAVEKSQEGSYASEVEVKDLSNLVMTVAGSQINIYDNEHYGDHLDLMCHFNLPQEDSEGEFTTCCWIKSPGDALLAFGGKAGKIHLVSMAFSQEFARINAHEGEITDIICHPSNDNFILSCARDGTIKLWDVTTKRCLLHIDYKATVSAFSSQGDYLLVGNSKGDIEKVCFPSIAVLERIKRPITDLDFTTVFPSKHHNATIDCLAVLGSNVVSKSKNGNVFFWSLESGEILSKFRVRNSSYNSSRFGISPNSKYMCVGNETGLVYIYSLADGKMLADLRHRRSTKPITSCAFAANGRNVVCANDIGFLLRFDYISPATLEEWETWSFE